MISGKSKDKLDKIVLPSWKELVIVRNNRVVKVDWEGDFILKEALDSVKDYRESRNAFNERSQLYQFLHGKRVVLNPISPGLSQTIRELIVYPCEDNKLRDRSSLFHREYYKFGPSHNGVIYSFNKLYWRIAESWVMEYNKRNPDREAFLPNF